MAAHIGVFGGTFDPPHAGHLCTAVNVRHALDLDLLLLVVANRPWQKVGTRTISSATERLALVEAAVAGFDRLAACDVELARGGDSYTADTLIDLRRLHPAARFSLVLGADAAAGLESWERVDEVRTNAELVVVDRPGAPAPQPLPGWRWRHVEVPHLAVSSTDIRGRVADGRPLDCLVSSQVIAAIEERRLYRDAE